MELHWLNPLCWAGPILDKELRVVSRRKRTYWIKGLFPVFLGLVVMTGWISVGRGNSLNAAGSEGLTRLSRSVVSSMTWMQFILCQCMAVIMMSHAMHDEMRRRTLDVLMTTPIRALQIVLGKLFGQLMTVWVVLALSFPVLAIVRVWGGVPWDFLVATLCVTVSATLCVGTFSLLTALWVKRSHHGILIVMTVLALGYVLNMFNRGVGAFSARSYLMLNPFSVFYSLNATFNSATGSLPQRVWLQHCAGMLGLSLFFLVLCVGTLRRRTASTTCGTGREGRFTRCLTRMFLGRKKRQAQAIRTVSDAPILWKELGCRPWIYVKRQLPWIILLSAALVMSILLCPRSVFQVSISMIRYVVMLRVGVMAALAVSQEKESRTWTSLLCTPVPDIWLLRHKALAVLLRNAAGWIPMFVGFAAYAMAEQGGGQTQLLSFVALFSFMATLYMVTGMGLYFSVRMRTGLMAITALLIGWVVWQFVSRMVTMLAIMNIGAFGGAVGPSFFSIQYAAMAILCVVVGAVALKLAGRNLRKYIF